MLLDQTNLTTPVLLLAFNRPELTRQVFEVIRSVQPKKLYVAVDAPRDGRPDDVENNNTVKRIVQDVDWPCETHYLFHEKNLGCSLSGVTAWNWIFQSEDRMIFIEDDGLATKTAFYFVQDLLERYKDNERVAYVGAVNHKLQYGDKSYFYSRYPDSTYFMGTWKRVYKLYDYDLDSYKDTRNKESYRKSFWGSVERIVQNRKFKSYRSSVQKNRRYNTYDTQMLFLSYKYNMYSIYPNINMISNIGTESGANSCSAPDSDYVKEYGNRERYEMETITYNDNIEIDYNFEKRHFKKRSLQNRSWIKVWFKEFFLQYFGGFYKKYIKPWRRR